MWAENSPDCPPGVIRTLSRVVGTPVRFVFKEGENPYKDKKNVLSDRQVAKKRRLIRHVKRKG